MRSVRRLVGVLAVTGVLAGCGGAHHTLRLGRNPYLGLACRATKVHECNRVGLAVWTAHPVSAVTAVVDGVSVRLRTRSAGTGSYGGRLFWQGFFHDPRAQRHADASASIPVRITLTASDGSISAATRTVFVSQGYG
jgi:hypothetical protein